MIHIFNSYSHGSLISYTIELILDLLALLLLIKLPKKLNNIEHDIKYGIKCIWCRSEIHYSGDPEYWNPSTEVVCKSCLREEKLQDFLVISKKEIFKRKIKVLFQRKIPKFCFNKEKLMIILLFLGFLLSVLQCIVKFWAIPILAGLCEFTYILMFRFRRIFISKK